MPRFFTVLTGLLMTAVILALAGCEKPVFDATSAEGKQGIIDTTNIYLTAGNCSAAIAEIEPVYKSVNSDNSIRLIASSAYACAAGMNFFKLVGDLATSAAELNEDQFWTLMARLFPSSAADPNDRVVEGALNATDALLSMIKPGAVIVPGNYINEGTFNPGAIFASDRDDNADIYMLFVNMATIGGLENRNGAPDSNHLKTRPLPWTTSNAPDMPGDGCAFASAIILLADNLGVVSEVAQGNLKTGVGNMVSLVQPKIYEACNLACVALGGSCPICPIKLRDRSQCSDPDSQEAKVAAALTTYVNSKWPTGP